MKTLLFMLPLLTACSLAMVKQTYHPQKEATLRVPRMTQRSQIEKTKAAADKMIKDFCAPQVPKLLEIEGGKYHRYQCVDRAPAGSK